MYVNWSFYEIQDFGKIPSYHKFKPILHTEPWRKKCSELTFLKALSNQSNMYIICIHKHLSFRMEKGLWCSRKIPGKFCDRERKQSPSINHVIKMRQEWS